ncbi:hypothetical protein EDD86DRAFT_253061 [Gorgonomyces haynaldii]|nr:hypothetical protein EDD86DRAFT_253061 [Gorgonomyces haynaldii]
MPSLKSTGGYLENFDLSSGGFVLFCFIFDITTITANFIVLLLLQFGYIKNTYSRYLSIVCVIDMSYKICFLIYAYIPSPAIVNWFYIFLGYLCSVCNTILQLELFKRFLVLADSIWKSKIKEYHVKRAQWTILVLYVVLCLASEIALLFHLGDRSFGEQWWFQIWYFNLLVVYAGALSIIFLSSSFYQIALLLSLLHNMEHISGKQHHNKSSVRKLFLAVVLVAVDVLIATFVHIINVLNPNQRNATLWFAISNSCFSLLAVFNLLVTMQIKAILMDAMSVPSDGQTAAFSRDMVSRIE